MILRGKIFKSNFVQQGVSFDEITNISKTQTQSQFQQKIPTPISTNTNTNEHITKFFEKSNELFGMDFTSLIKSISSFNTKMNQIEDINIQKSMYLNFIFQFLK